MGGNRGFSFFFSCPDTEAKRIKDPTGGELAPQGTWSVAEAVGLWNAHSKLCATNLKSNH